MTPLPSKQPMYNDIARAANAVGDGIRRFQASETRLEISESDAEASTSIRDANAALNAQEVVTAGDLSIRGIDYDKSVYSDPSMPVPKYEFLSAFEGRVFDDATEAGAKNIKDPVAREKWINNREINRNNVMEVASKRAAALRKSEGIERRADVMGQAIYDNKPQLARDTLEQMKYAGEFEDEASYQVAKAEMEVGLEESKWNGVALNGTPEERADAIALLKDDKDYSEEGGVLSTADRKTAINKIEEVTEGIQTAEKNSFYAQIRDYGDLIREAKSPQERLNLETEAEAAYNQIKYLLNTGQQDSLRSWIDNDFRREKSDLEWLAAQRQEMIKDPEAYYSAWQDGLADPTDPTSELVFGYGTQVDVHLNTADRAAFEKDMMERVKAARTGTESSVKNNDDARSATYSSLYGRNFNADRDGTKTKAKYRDQAHNFDMYWDGLVQDKLREVYGSNWENQKLTNAQFNELRISAGPASNPPKYESSFYDPWFGPFGEQSDTTMITADMGDIPDDVEPLVISLFRANRSEGQPMNYANIHRYWHEVLQRATDVDSINEMAMKESAGGL